MTEVVQAFEQAWSRTPEQIPAFNVLSLERRVHEIAEGFGFLPFIYNMMPVKTDDGLVLIDTGLQEEARANFERLRAWSGARLHTVVYTHGHADHAYGVAPFDQESVEKGWAAPRVVAHEAVVARFDRYTETHGYNQRINTRQFRGYPVEFPTAHRYPDLTYNNTKTLSVGGRRLDLHHARGETDDHTWVFLVDEKVLFPGDLFAWVVPNAGNPQKVQRYAKDWATALREMVACRPEILVPSHGLPVFGSERVIEALSTTATLLEFLHDETVALMNEGAPLNEILHTVRPPAELLAKPWLGAIYDEPEFIVRNVWRLRGGWYDGDPAHLKPPPDADLAAEIATLAGGANALADRAAALVVAGELRVAAQLAEWAGKAAPNDEGVQRIRGHVYSTLADASTSLMAKGIYGAAADDSSAGIGGRSVDALVPAGKDAPF